MLSAALLSTVHLFALAIGLAGVVIRWRQLRRLVTDPAALEPMLVGDNLWGVAALLWLVTGLLRAFGTFEKGSGYYLSNHAFLLKLGLFGAIFLLELWPMVTFVQWRLRKAKGLAIDTSRAATFATITGVELALTITIPFVASMMARGIGFTWFS
ncbi:MAG: DUF2214 family protein [Archangiaceae bacterium]|nr:DUF2214 family protein [Archangiaceae bacterium]